ncbi:MAG: purple acid phosphatase family protein [Actinomycetes bacterium]
MPPLSRRSFLLATAAAGVSVAVPAGAAPAGRLSPVGGPLGHVYGAVGVPRGRTLGLTATGSGRTVTWLTTGDAVPGIVQWGLVPDDAPAEQARSGRFLTSSVPASTAAAPGGSFDDDTGTTTPVEGEHPVHVHKAVLPELPAGSRYCYRVGDGVRWSAVEVATTRAADAPFVLGHVGDHGANAASRRTTSALLERRPDAVLLAGDISYANGYQPRWDEWAGQAEPLTSVVPLLPAPGNHEAKDYYGETYRRRFSTPAGGRNWYTADLGRAHLFVGTAGCFLTENDPTTAVDLVVDELLGLERSLALAAARRAAGEVDFLVVAQHFPLYTNHATRGPFSPELVVAQEHILQRYQVDLVLVGHDHMFQRSARMAYGNATGGGLGYVQVVAGAGGQSLYEFADPDSDAWGDWCVAWARQFSFAEHRIETGQLTTTVRAWDDSTDSPNDVDMTLAPRVIDESVLRRKPEQLVRAAASRPVRDVAEVLAGVPEARGVVVRNLAEDCTRHAH